LETSHGFGNGGIEEEEYLEVGLPLGKNMLDASGYIQ